MGNLKKTNKRELRRGGKKWWRETHKYNRENIPTLKKLSLQI
jgi:hypothetical protein